MYLKRYVFRQIKTPQATTQGESMRISKNMHFASFIRTIPLVLDSHQLSRKSGSWTYRKNRITTSEEFHLAPKQTYHFTIII